MKRITFLIIGFIFLFQFGFSQIDTTLYYAGNNKPSTEKKAIRYDRIVEKKPGAYKIERYFKRHGEWKIVKRNETVIVTSDSSLLIVVMEEHGDVQNIIRKYKEVNNGFQFTEVYSNGRLKMEGVTRTFFPLYLEGEVKTYYKSGKIESIRYYKNNQMLANRYFNEKGEKQVDNLFEDADILPEYPGGDEAFDKDLSKVIRYPIRAQENGITGCVYVRFIVDEEGEMIDVIAESGSDYLLERAACKAISSIKKKWKPAVLDGKKVKIGFRVPINFELR